MSHLHTSASEDATSVVHGQGSSRGAGGLLTDPQVLESLKLGDAPDVTVIRVHGVGGSTPETDLPGDFVTRVAGDRIAGFYRKVNETGRRHSEAYSWGGLTSGRRVRALWALLFPFMLANMAGWASAPRKKEDASAGPVHWFRLAAARLASLSLTIGFVQALSLLVMDVIAFQFGGSVASVAGSWWLAPFFWFDLPANPSHRLLTGALVIAAVLVGILIVSARSRNLYEGVPRVHRTSEKLDEDPPACSAAELPGGLANRYFWSGFAAHSRLSNLHLGAAVSQLAFTLAWCVSRITAGTGTEVVPWLSTASAALAALALLIAITGTAWVSTRPQQGEGHWQQKVGTLLPPVALIVAVAAAIGAGATAAAQTIDRRAYVGQAAGMIEAFNIVWGAVALLLAPLAFTGVEGIYRWLKLGLPGVLRRPGSSPDNLDQYPGSPSTSAPLRSDGIGNVHPFSIFAAGFISVHVLLLSLIIFTADSLSGGHIQNENMSFADLTKYGGMLFVPPMVGVALSYIVWGSVILATAISLVGFMRLWLVHRRKHLKRLLRDDQLYVHEQTSYHNQSGTAQAVAKWLLSATPDLSRRKGTGPATARRLHKQHVRWLRGIARALFLAHSTPYFALLLNASATVAVVVLLFSWSVIFGPQGQTPPAISLELTAQLALAIPPAMAAFVLLAWRDPKRRRLLGVLWDVGTFFPRAFHPFAPPCYGERAVPELVRRIWWLNDNNGEVVVAAHSQGSVLAAAAALQRAVRAAHMPRFVLVTYGSPLRKMYGEVFPAWWSPSQIRAINQPPKSLVIDKGWMNIYYDTDYIGGWVDVPDVNRTLSDPATSIYVFGQPPPPIRQHTGYVHDPRFQESVRTIENLLPQGSKPAEQQPDTTQPPCRRERGRRWARSPASMMRPRRAMVAGSGPKWTTIDSSPGRSKPTIR